MWQSSSNLQSFTWLPYVHTVFQMYTINRQTMCTFIHKNAKGEPMILIFYQDVPELCKAYSRKWRDG